MTAITSAALGLSIVIIAGAVNAEPCAPGFGVFYDELHSFRVSAPRGWCCSKVDSGHLCRPTEASGPTPAIEISFRYLDTLGGDLDLLAPGELASFSLSGSVSEQPSIRTRDGSAIRVWHLSGASANRFVGLVVHETVLVRFELNAPLSADHSSLDAFRELVSSLHSV